MQLVLDSKLTLQKELGIKLEEQTQRYKEANKLKEVQEKILEYSELDVWAGVLEFEKESQK